LGPGFQPTVQDYAAAGQTVSDVASDVAFGPERTSAFGGDASRPERTLRDWGLSEQEFRASGSAFDEGRPLAGLGWGALGLAGAVPFFGQAGRGLVRGVGAVGDVARGAGAAADVGRGGRPITEAWEKVVSPETGRIVNTDLGSIGVGDSGVIPSVSPEGRPRLSTVTRSETPMPSDPSSIVPFTPDARLRPLVRTGEEAPPSHLYRVMSREEFEQARQRGYIQSDQRSNLVAGEGTVFSLRPTSGFYAPSSGDGVVIRVRYDDADGWVTNPDDGYIKTEQQIPFDRVDSFEEFGTEAADAAADVRRAAEVGRFDLPVSPLKVPSDKVEYANNLSKFTNLVYREMSPTELSIVSSGQGFGIGGRQLWVSNSPDLALGQGFGPRILVEYDAKFFGDVRPGNKPGWQFSWDAGGAEFLVRPQEKTREVFSERLGRSIPVRESTEADAIRSVTIPEETLREIRPSQMRYFGENFTRENVSGGVRFTRKNSE
jgi:hypothetical protein